MKGSAKDAAKRAPRIFLLSPANAAGQRARLVMSERARFELALRLRAEGAPLGDVFSFMSGLYFRGKMAYARAFAAAPRRAPASVVITSGRGLVPPESTVTVADLVAMAGVAIDVDTPAYREPLERDVRLLAAATDPACTFVLLGSVATAKYVDPLLAILGERLLFPSDFVGRGDMSRGGLMLRCAREGTELEYAPVAGAARRGPRPPRLPRLG